MKKKKLCRVVDKSKSKIGKAQGTGFQSGFDQVESQE
jgi:hypothetical protein